ncbi:unnamed protein product [Closterium sp. NIES-54]
MAADYLTKKLGKSNLSQEFSPPCLLPLHHIHTHQLTFQSNPQSTPLQPSFRLPLLPLHTHRLNPRRHPLHLLLRHRLHLPPNLHRNRLPRNHIPQNHPTRRTIRPLRCPRTRPPLQRTNSRSTRLTHPRNSQSRYRAREKPPRRTTGSYCDGGDGGDDARSLSQFGL